MLWATACIHPRLTWLLFSMMGNTIKNAPRVQLPKSAKEAMMWVTDQLTGSISGGGSVRYYSAPKTGIQATGIGRFEALASK